MNNRILSVKKSFFYNLFEYQKWGFTRDFGLKGNIFFKYFFKNAKKCKKFLHLKSYYAKILWK